MLSPPALTTLQLAERGVQHGGHEAPPIRHNAVMVEPGGPTLGDWAAVIAAGAALLSLLAALLAWQAPRGVGPAVAGTRNS